jgi:hypothetical protein
MRHLWDTAIRSASLAVGLMSFILPTASYACAVCGGAEDSGYFWGVLFLMAMPFAVGSFVGGWLLFNYRHASSAPSPLTPPPAIQTRTPQPTSAPEALERSDEGH